MILADKIIRSKRRTISAEFDKNANLIVRAPGWMSEKLIQNFIIEKQSWISKNKSVLEQRKNEIKVPNFKQGEQFLYQGELYSLEIGDFKDQRLHLDGCFRLSHFYANEGRKIFIDWYKKQALEVFQLRVHFYADQNSFSYKGIRVNQACRQWGSCTADNRLSFTWRLVMAPLFVIDSVVVHELVHTKIKNHSPKFWKQVHQIFPAYKNASAWIKKNAHLLIF